MVTFEHRVHYVQVKEAISMNEAAWTILWQHFWKQFDRIDHVRDRLVLWGGQHTALFRGLQEMANRAQSVPPGKHRRQASEFTGRLTKSQLGWLDGITAIIRESESGRASEGQPLEITRPDVFELLQTVDVVVKGAAEEIEEQAINTFFSSISNAPVIFATLRDLTADKARTRGAWDYESLRTTLAARGVRLGVSDKPDPGTNQDTEREALAEELEMHRRNLRKLRQQAAVYAEGEKPLRLLNQIEHEEGVIRELEQRLGR